MTAAASSSMTDGPVLGAFRITGGRTFYEAQAVEIIDQLALPHTIRWEQVDTVQGAFDAIKSMKVRSLVSCFLPLKRVAECSRKHRPDPRSSRDCLARRSRSRRRTPRPPERPRRSLL
jgi:hypothetical protein